LTPNRNAVETFSPGLPLRLPWEREWESINRKAVAALAFRWRNRLAVGNQLYSFTQGSRGGNPGLEAITALRFISL